MGPNQAVLDNILRLITAKGASVPARASGEDWNGYTLRSLEAALTASGITVPSAVGLGWNDRVAQLLGALADGASAGASEWTQLTTVEQAGNAISDPASRTTTGTGFDGDLFTWVQVGGAGDIQIDGYQEDWAGWSIPLLTLYPDFDPDTDEIELALEIAAMPLTTAKHGLFVGITDRTITPRASIGAAGGAHVFPNSATNTNGGIIGATGLGSNGSPVSGSSVAVTAIRCRLRWLDQASPQVWVTADASRGASEDVSMPTVGSVGAAFNATIANWRVVVGHVHVSATAGTPTLAARVYHRRLRTAGVPFP